MKENNTGDTPRSQAVEPSRRGWRWTLERKLIAIVTGLVSLAFAVIVTLAAVSERQHALEHGAESHSSITQLLAKQVSGGVRFRKAVAVDRVIAELRDIEGQKLVEVLVLDASGQALSHFLDPDATPMGLDRVLAEWSADAQPGDTVIHATGGGHFQVLTAVTAGKNATLVGWLAVHWSLASDLEKTAYDMYQQIGVSVGLLSVLVAALILLMRAIISRPLDRITGVMGKLAAGELDVKVPALANQDEIGAMARAVEVFKRNAVENRRLQEQQRQHEAERRRRQDTEHQAQEQRRREAEQAAERQRDEEARQRQELDARDQAAAERRRREMLALADDFQVSVMGVVDSVSQAAGEMKTTAERVKTAAEITNQRSGTVSQASEQAAANVGSVATAAEQLSASVGEISSQVTQSSHIAQQAVGEAERAGATAQSLAEAAQTIDKVLNMISNIAAQTNLLALNATIEAARAGEAGKGFAVVASEVKTLATQTARATDEIAQQIAGMQAATGEVVGAISSIGATIGELNRIASFIAHSMQDQREATQDIARNVHQAADGTNQVSVHIGEVNRAAADVGGAVGEVLDAATALAHQSETLRGQVERFLGAVKSA